MRSSGGMRGRERESEREDWTVMEETLSGGGTVECLVQSGQQS